MAPRAHLLVLLPPDRYRILQKQNGKAPQAGDVVQLDQGFTGPNGEAMVLAYGIDSDGQYIYEAELFETEIGPDIV